MTSMKKQLRRAVLKLRRAVLNDAGAERAKRGHPWIFRGSLLQVPACAPGDIIAFADRRGEVLGWGLWSESALCIRVLSLGSHEPDQMALLRSRVEAALEARKKWCAGEECFRWVHGEGDRLPGVTADLYGDVLSLQLSAYGWYRHADEVAKIFRKVKKLSAVILRNDTKHLDKEGIPREVKPLLGDMPEKPLRVRIGGTLERGTLELVDVAGGQKTGAYLDVRHVPALVEPLYKGAEVLDCFCYQGHFTAHALKSGAAHVTAIDQSEAALARAKENLALNGLDCSRAEFRCGNAFDIMREIDAERKRFDLVIMDPPPFSPSKGQLDSARRGYKGSRCAASAASARAGISSLCRAATPSRATCSSTCWPYGSGRMSEIKAALFDFDMTLVDSSWGIAHCTNEFAKLKGLRPVPRETVMAAIGLTIIDSWKMYWGEFREDWLAEYREKFRGEERKMLRLFPDTIPTLDALRGAGVKTGLVSNRQFARNPAEYLGIADKFDVIIGLEDVTHAKPDPEPLLTALSRLGVEPAQAVYVGDTDIDMKTAAAAGVRGIGVTTGNFSAEQHLAAGAWRVCGSLAEAAALCGVEPRK